MSEPHLFGHFSLTNRLDLLWIDIISFNVFYLEGGRKS